MFKHGVHALFWVCGDIDPYTHLLTDAVALNQL